MALKISLSRYALVLLILVAAARGESLAAPTAAVIAQGKQATALVQTAESEGSAFCIHSEGYFITNAHVVEDARNAVLGLTLSPGEKEQKSIRARVVLLDDELDLAILKAQSRTKFVELPRGKRTSSLRPCP